VSFLRPDIVNELFVVCETTAGTEMFPADLVGVNEPFGPVLLGTDEPTDPVTPELAGAIDPLVSGIMIEVECVRGWFARLSAPGYLDCTEWCGPFSSEKEASSYLKRMYEDD